MKTPVIVKEDYILWYEPVSMDDSLHVFVHCDVKRWSPRIKRALKEDFETLRSLTKMPAYALHDVGDTKHLKFLIMFGFIHEIDLPEAKSLFVLE